MSGLEWMKSMLKRSDHPAWVRYWRRRISGEEHKILMDKNRRKVSRIHKQVRDNKKRLATLKPPVMTLESRHPSGVIVHWEPPTDWHPDDYDVLVREVGTKGWRSVASTSINVDTRQQVLTRSYLAWGPYREPYEILVRAHWAGVGVVACQPQQYPPVGA